VLSPEIAAQAAPRRLVVGISGSSGAVYGARLIEVLRSLENIESHLVISKGARSTIGYETDYDPDEVMGMADVVYQESELGATIASGTFQTAGMVILPCSIKTLSQVATSNAGTLLVRAADVTLKERRRLVLCVRETPLHAGHLKLMLAATEAGAVILPPVPGFYIRPKTLGDIVDHTVTKVLDMFGIDAGLIERWTGLGASA
jgi:4-hydroxy-3-polyprenylbenzoate decarboxylase